MAINAWRLPWSGPWVPHALLDLLRGCNISCRACYNTGAPRMKSWDEICEEFALLTARRRLDSIALIGGEPTLHPQLDAIVRLIKQAGLSVELFTNGVLLDQERLARLKAAGADVIFLHIDAHQQRPDVPPGDGVALRALWARLAAAVAAAGMEVGLAITAYDDGPEEIDAAVDFVLHSPCADYLLVTLQRDTQALGDLTGDLDVGIRGQSPAAVSAPAALSIPFLHARLLQRPGLAPFAYLGSNRDPQAARWLSYLVGSIVHRNGTARWVGLKASGFERLFLWLCRQGRGRYPFFTPQAPGRIRAQLLLNAFSGGRLFANLQLLAHSLGRRRSLRAKKILLQCPAELAPDGSLTHCEPCPDATVRHGKLVPVCIGDQVINPLTKDDHEQPA